MVKLLLNNKYICDINFINYEELIQSVEEATKLNSNEFYISRNGKKLFSQFEGIKPENDVQCWLRMNGGKGGFGSMLRAIGAQIEKTTNREACRDLSGRRLRDINEEKRLKAWIDKQAEREREAEERKKRKIEKLLTVPKHEFKDEEYENARSKLTEKVNDAVEEGFKKEQYSKKSEEVVDKSGIKRKCTSTNKVDHKKKKTALWIDDDISSSDDSEDEAPVCSQKATDVIPSISSKLD